jgi:hypothetical protein
VSTPEGASTGTVAMEGSNWSVCPLPAIVSPPKPVVAIAVKDTSPTIAAMSAEMPTPGISADIAAIVAICRVSGTAGASAGTGRLPA